MNKFRDFKKIVRSGACEDSKKCAFLLRKKNLTIETNIPTLTPEKENNHQLTTGIKTSLITPLAESVIHNSENSFERSLKSQIKQANYYFKFYKKTSKKPFIDKNKTTQFSCEMSSVNAGTNNNLDVYSNLKQQEKNLFLDKKSNPFNLFKMKFLAKNMKVLKEKNNKVYSQNKSATNKREKLLFQNYLQDPEKTKSQQGNLLKKCLEKQNIQRRSQKKLFNLTNPRKSTSPNTSISDNNFYKKIEDLKEKFDLHMCHHCESLVESPNIFNQKKDLGLKEYYEKTKYFKYEPTQPQLQINTTSNTPKIERLKSYYTPKMSILMSRNKRHDSKAEKFPNFFSFGTKEFIENQSKKTIIIPEDKPEYLEQNEKTEINEKNNQLSKKKNSILEQNNNTIIIQKNLNEAFEYEKLLEYKDKLSFSPLKEDEKLFLESIKRNDLKQVKLMLENNINYLKIKDQNLSTPLHWAAKRGYSKMIDLLIENGANVDHKDILGRTPKKVALIFGHSDCLSKLKFSKTILASNTQILGS